MLRSDPSSWQEALTEFLLPWRELDAVEGAVVTGSRVFGTATARSDVDVHIVLIDGIEWRERGNRMVRAHLIEYFANPIAQIKKYMEEDHRAGKRNDARMFALGRVVFDRRGEVEELRRYAKDQFALPFTELDHSETELAKYGLWDQLDGLRDLRDERSPGFAFAAAIALAALVETYARYLRLEVPPLNRLHRFLTDPTFRERYFLAELPDAGFSDLLRRALEETDEQAVLDAIDRLTSHVLDSMGGFDIDGWRLRSEVSL
jgi:predicted nucleotidyltransferase